MLMVQKPKQPPGMYKTLQIIYIIGYSPYQSTGLPDFFHQQYLASFLKSLIFATESHSKTYNSRKGSEYPYKGGPLLVISKLITGI